MIVGIIGSGGREHAICEKIKESPRSSQIFCIPGNAGTNSIAQNVDIKINDFKSIKEFCLKRKIELLIVGPEQPLVDGIVDYFNDTKIKIFGPNKISSQLEGSKIFTKKICEKYNIPTADFKIFQNFEEPNIEQKLLLIIEHLEELIREKGNHGIIIARKHISWTCKNFKGATVLRNKLLKAVDIDEVKDLINKRIDSLNYEEKILSC